MHVRVNSPQVTHQTIDGETIILNLESGIYYSTDGSGALIWEGVAQGTTTNEVMAQLARRYHGDAMTFSTAVEHFLSELQQEGLLVSSSDGKSVFSQPNDWDILFPVPSEPFPFEPPVLQKYTDMQDLLLLDPIHEVDETGWPLEKGE